MEVPLAGRRATLLASDRLALTGRSRERRLLMRLVGLVVVLATILTPGLTLADCGDDHQQVMPAATVAEEQPDAVQSTTCNAGREACRETPASSDRNVAAFPIDDARADTVPRP
jgi:hypothetical protein